VVAATVSPASGWDSAPTPIQIALVVTTALATGVVVLRPASDPIKKMYAIAPKSARLTLPLPDIVLLPPAASSPDLR
jgi:hypothetical protein